MIEIMPESSHSPKRSKRMIFLMIFFIIVLAVIIYSSFFAEVSFTGNFISEGNSEGIPLDATFDSVPNLSISGEFSSVSLRGLKGASLYIGNQKFPMNDSNRIFMTDYEGDISFNSNTISRLKGKVSYVSLNGLPILPGSGKDIKVYIENPLGYSFLDLPENVSIKEIKYLTSGKIVFGEQKSIVNLDNDTVLIERFTGGIRVSDEKMSLEGVSKKLETKGNHEISISA